MFISCVDMLISSRLLRVSADLVDAMRGHRCRASHHMTYFICIPALYKVAALPKMDNNPKYIYGTHLRHDVHYSLLLGDMKD